MKEVHEALLRMGVPANEEISDLVSKMQENQLCPSFYMECIATGAFKEVYNASDSVVIKFAIDTNYTMDTEAHTYEKIPDNLFQYFAKSIFISLDKTFPSSYFNEDENAPIDCIIIQEKIHKTMEKCNREILDRDDEEDYNKSPLYETNGDIIPFKDAIDFSYITPYKLWLQEAINHYGKDSLKELSDFCDEMSISDLHRGNIGFRTDGSPVIIDFLS
jgi:hypothetical protein